MGFGLLPAPYTHTHTPLFWLGNDVCRTPPPPQEFTLGPTCSVVREGVKEASFFLSSVVFLWLLGKHLHMGNANTQKGGSLFIGPPNPLARLVNIRH